MHAGDWDSDSTRLFRTQFKMVSPKRVSNPNNIGDTRNCRAGVKINDSGAALGYYVSDDGYPGWMAQNWTYIPRELPGGRPSFIHVFEPMEDGQTRGANAFYSVMEQMKMLDTLQNTQLQSAIVKAMYAATIESELDTQSAMDFILGADNKEQQSKLTGWLGEMASYYSAAPVRPGGARVPHLLPGDSLNLQSAQDTDNGYSTFEQSLLRYIAAGLGVSYEQLSRNYSQMSYSTARASANESGRTLWGVASLWHPDRPVRCFFAGLKRRLSAAWSRFLRKPGSVSRGENSLGMPTGLALVEWQLTG